MDAPDGQVPAPRRPAAPSSRRRPGGPSDLPFAVPGDDAAARVPELSALLADIDAMRLTLQTDLSLAAAALEAGADDLAGELVTGDLAELRAFAARSASRLELLAAEDVPADELAVTPLRRRRILSAAPLMAAAAALIGFVAFSPGRSAPSQDMSLTSATMAGIELNRLAQEGAPDEELRLAAEELNDELAALIAQAGDDPLAAQQALMLLEQTSEVLAGQGNSGVLRSVMAETRALRALLRETLPVVAQRPARTVRQVARPVVPVLPRVQDQPEKERTASSAPPKSSPKPSASPKPAPASPSPAPSPQPEPTKATPAPSGEPEGPLPQPDDLPGA